MHTVNEKKIQALILRLFIIDHLSFNECTAFPVGYASQVRALAGQAGWGGYSSTTSVPRVGVITNR